jgi:hypothetical protein
MPLFDNIEEVQKLGSVTKVESIAPRDLPDEGHPIVSIRKKIAEVRAPSPHITHIPFGITIAIL